VGTALALDGRAAVDAGADLIVVIGGDGTLLAVSRSLGSQQIPLVGLNFGKLGFLAEFTMDQFRANLDTVLANGRYVSESMILRLSVHRGRAVLFESLAINDCVVQGGFPFRVVGLAVRIGGVHLTSIEGDGLIVCTPVGSTAHNLSAGGPIMQVGVRAIALTPLCPHSLTHRPLVVEHHAKIEIVVERANEGTRVTVDGQLGCPLSNGDRIAIERYGTNMLLVRNPAAPKWHSLVTKMHWGQPPSL
jgi:NAD+ kinase